MSDHWDDVGVHLGGTREFLVNVEVFVAGSTALRKPHNTKKKSDKRDNVKQSTGVLEDKRIKEKASWLSFPKDPTAEGHWRAATCKLTEEGERAILNVYVDESILYQSIFIHLLHHSDIRHAHPSLFQRKNCLAVYCVAGKRRSSPNMDEPIHLQFASTDICHTWLSLLRSYALPEIYGRWIYSEEGGSYRMWRQVELTVIQGRNLGNTKLFDGASDNMDESDSTSGPDPVDLDVTCDIQLNEATCGRTTIKKGVGSPDWHESFVFSDLPPFENLDVVVWRVKKLFKSSRLGRIRIVLNNFPRGEAVEGWFPVLKSESTLGDLHVGDVRLKLRVDEELILPFSAYDRLLKKLRSRNFLDWMTDLETKLKLKTVSTQLMSIAVADNTLIEQVSAVADREVDGSVSSHQTLFRGNNNLTRIAEQTMAWYGMDFLESSIGNVLRRLVAEKVCIEVDPMRSGKSPKDIERNVETLVTWCKRIWSQIFAARQSCPPEMRRLFRTIRELVEKRFPLQDNRELPWKCVSAFVFLRFIVPAILHPHLFGISAGLPSERVQRSLTLIAKVIQSLANLNANVQKEEFMVGVKDFLRDSLPAMTDYLLAVSSAPEEIRTPAPNRGPEQVVARLQQRVSSMPTLYREAIPILPHLLDPARHLAIITSAVIRKSRTHLPEPRPHDSHDRPLEDLCSRCIEVEEKALKRVNQLAAQLSANQKKTPRVNTQTQDTPFAFSPPSPKSPSSARSGRSGRSERPSTAPSVSDADSSRRRLLFDPTASSGPHSPFIRSLDTSSPSAPRNRLLHLKSTSTDSITTHIPRGTHTSPMTDSKHAELPVDISDDPAKRKKKFGIWRR
ncbi:gtpase activating protein [Moniliophthora roreri MCA 2997]|uniref:Gtpase activating protein n=1 Tax=Moniliophthora roreri (strain MCA 2997) TaxID=1381753 RepID=V2X8S3_MONRO|nr:gtpase activating protein [Moniliophthora roreri MCA 2997]